MVNKKMIDAANENQCGFCTATKEKVVQDIINAAWNKFELTDVFDEKDYLWEIQSIEITRHKYFRVCSFRTLEALGDITKATRYADLNDLIHVPDNSENKG